MPTARRLDRIDVANQVSDGYIRRCKFFYVTVFCLQKSNRRAVAIFFNQFAAAAANRIVRIVVDLASGNVRKLAVQQSGQLAQNAALGLSAQTEKNKIVP